MNAKRVTPLALAIGLALSLGACGGGSTGGGINSAPPPLTAPPAPPTSPPPSPPGGRGPIGLVSDQEFATHGFSYRYSTNSAGGEPQGPAAPDRSERIEFRYLADQNAYEIQLPGYQRGTLTDTRYNGSICADGTVCNPTASFSAVTAGNTSGRQDVGVTLISPAQNTSLELSYTSLGWWQAPNAVQAHQGRVDRNDGLFAYGVPTVAADIPRTGTGAYTALVHGQTDAASGLLLIDGTAQLLFDFGAGILAGHMRPEICPWDCYSLGEYQLAQTVFSVGGTRFSGQFAVPGSTDASFFEGRFTGPRAAELMARWQAPFRTPGTNQWGTMFGVWVGERQ